MDGTLVDSEIHWVDAEKSFVAHYGIKYSQEWVDKITGKSLVESCRLFKEQHNLPHPHEEILAKKIAASDSVYTDKCQPMPGVEKLLQQLKNAGLKLAVASGSPLDRIVKVVTRFGWGKYFDELCSTDHVNYVGKPDPAVFNYAAKVLGMIPGDCVVIEDSMNGVVAAQKACMPCVAVVNPLWSTGDFSVADLAVNSLEDQKIYEFLGIKYV